MGSREQRAYAEIPFKVLKWAYDSFGEIALNRDERAARMVEEAIEVAQVESVPLEIVQRIAARVYSRPVGNLGQEIGGLMLGLYALAGNTDIDIHAEFEKEFARVKSKPRDWWTRKHAEKVEAGTADLSLPPSTNEEKTLWVPTAQVERMMRECLETDSFQIEVGIEVMKGLLADVLTWRKERLLHKPSTHAPSGCYCTERCAAPIVQGRQTPCRDPDKAARFKAAEQPSSNQCGHTPLFAQDPVRWAERVTPCLYCKIESLTHKLRSARDLLSGEFYNEALGELDNALDGRADETTELQMAHQAEENAFRNRDSAIAENERLRALLHSVVADLAARSAKREPDGTKVLDISGGLLRRIDDALGSNRAAEKAGEQS